MKTQRTSVVISLVLGLGVAACQGTLYTGMEGQGGSAGGLGTGGVGPGGIGGSGGAGGSSTGGIGGLSGGNGGNPVGGGGSGGSATAGIGTGGTGGLSGGNGGSPTGGTSSGGIIGGGGSAVDAGSAGSMCNGRPLPANPGGYPVCAPAATMVVCTTCQGLQHPECGQACMLSGCWDCVSSGWSLSPLDCPMNCGARDAGSGGTGGIIGSGGVPTGGTGAAGAIGSGGTGGIIGSGGSGGSAGASGSTVTASGGSLPADAPPAEVWKVTIDVFSGVPNPVFTLEPSEVAEVQARLDSAPWVRPMASANETIIPARLGYRGMQVRASAGGNVIEDTEISEGTILRRTTGAVYDGKSVDLEGYLLSLAVAKGTISQGLADQIKSQSHGSIP
jgi:hypothetical protein